MGKKKSGSGSRVHVRGYTRRKPSRRGGKGKK